MRAADSADRNNEDRARPAKSTVFLFLVSAGFVLLAAAMLHASRRAVADRPLLEQKRQVVRDLSATDLCLFTDARYTRHLSMADLHTPFQDHPHSLEHFPSGALLAPPPHLEKR